MKVAIVFEAFIPTSPEGLIPLLVYIIYSGNKNIIEDKKLQFMNDSDDTSGEWKTFATEDSITVEMMADKINPDCKAYIF